MAVIVKGKNLLTRDQVRTLLLVTMPAKGLSTSSVQTARTVMVAVLAEAARSRMIPENVASGIRPLKHRKPGEFRDIPLPFYVRQAIEDHVEQMTITQRPPIKRG